MAHPGFGRHDTSGPAGTCLAPARGYEAISMSTVVAEYDRVADLDLWRSLTRSLVERGHGEYLRRYVFDLTASRSCEV